MAHRLIGIETDGPLWRIAVLQTEKGRTRLLKVVEYRTDGEDALADCFGSLPGGTLQHGDRLCLSLPANSGWLRRLRFPFSDRRAVGAALPLELAGQLPLGLDGCEIASQDPVAEGGGASVLAMAVRRSTLSALLEPCEAAGIPVQIVDLLPCAVATGSAGILPDSYWLLVSGIEEELLLRVQDGRLSDWRVLPHANTDEPSVFRVQRIVQSLGGLHFGADGDGAPLLVAGTGATDILAALLDAGVAAEAARPHLDGQPVPAEILPAVLCALRAGRSGSNFRRGTFAQRNEWSPWLRQLWIGAALLLLAILTSAVAGFLDYRHRVRRAEGLKTELTQLYRELVPGAAAVVDPLLQLQGKMAELGRSARLGGADREHMPLAVLREISRLTPGDLTVEIRDFSWTPEEARLEGTASSFDSAGRFSTQLEQSPLFTAVRLTDTRALAEGGRVEFRMTLPFPTSQEQRR